MGWRAPQQSSVAKGKTSNAEPKDKVLVPDFHLHLEVTGLKGGNSAASSAAGI